MSSVLHDVISRAPLDTRDRIPSFLLNAQGLVIGYTSYRNRLVVGLLIIAIAVAVALVLAGARVLELVLGPLDVLALLGLFLVNWIGNGGVLVPIPGARMVGLLMIFQNAVLLPAVEVVGVAGAAMALGLLSYYIAGARAARAYQSGNEDDAEQLASDSGMLEPGQAEAPDIASFLGAGIEGPTHVQDAAAQSAAGLEPDGNAEPAAGSRRQRAMRRFVASWERAVERAQPAVQKHGVTGMFWLCFAPTPLGTAAAFLGGAMGFGFSRYLLASFAAKYLLTFLIVIIALAVSGGAGSFFGGR